MMHQNYMFCINNDLNSSRISSSKTVSIHMIRQWSTMKQVACWLWSQHGTTFTTMAEAVLKFRLLNLQIKCMYLWPRQGLCEFYKCDEDATGQRQEHVYSCLWTPHQHPPPQSWCSSTNESCLSKHWFLVWTTPGQYRHRQLIFQ